MAALRANNIDARVVDTADEAGRLIRKLMAAPDYMLGSVQAITEGGDLVVASASASQLGPYANSAGRLILVVGGRRSCPTLTGRYGALKNTSSPTRTPWSSNA